MTTKLGLYVFTGCGPSLSQSQAHCKMRERGQWVVSFPCTNKPPSCFYLLLHLACWACSSRADSDPVLLCPQMGPKETDDTQQQTTQPILGLCCHLYGCWHHRTHLKCLKWLLSAAGSARPYYSTDRKVSNVCIAIIYKEIEGVIWVSTKIYKNDGVISSVVCS